MTGRYPGDGTALEDRINSVTGGSLVMPLFGYSITEPCSRCHQVTHTALLVDDPDGTGDDTAHRLCVECTLWPF